MTKLIRKGDVLKNGGARYGLEGVRSSAYFPPTMFVGEPPEYIEIDEETRPVNGPDGNPLMSDSGDAVVAGTVFATRATQRPRAGTTGGVRVNAELAKAREEAKRLREESKKVLKEARERIKSGRSTKANATQESLVEA